MPKTPLKGSVRKKAVGLSIDDVDIPKWGDTGPPSRKKFKSDAEFQAATDKYNTEQLLKNVMDKARIPNKIDPGRIKNLRFSGLPFCALRWFIKLPINLGKEKSVDFGFRYFTHIGHAVHAVIQEAVEKTSGLMFLKDFVCADKTCGKRYALLPQQPFECSCGSFVFNSEEHEVVWRKAVGHVDEIIVRDPKKPKRVILWDYKTTSMRNLNKKDSVEYVSQIRSYATALVDAGYEIEAIYLVYVPRDNPFAFRVSPVEWNGKVHANHLKWMEFWVDQHAAGMAVASLEDALDLLADRPCKNESAPKCYSTCEYKDYCLSSEDHQIDMHKRVVESFNKVNRWLPLNKSPRK